MNIRSGFMRELIDREIYLCPGVLKSGHNSRMNDRSGFMRELDGQENLALPVC